MSIGQDSSTHVHRHRSASLLAVAAAISALAVASGARAATGEIYLDQGEDDARLIRTLSRVPAER
jgi:hypothetical protein